MRQSFGAQSYLSSRNGYTLNPAASRVHNCKCDTSEKHGKNRKHVLISKCIASAHLLENRFRCIDTDILGCSVIHNNRIRPQHLRAIYMTRFHLSSLADVAYMIAATISSSVSLQEWMQHHTYVTTSLFPFVYPNPNPSPLALNGTVYVTQKMC